MTLEQFINRIDDAIAALERIANVLEQCQEDGTFKTKDVERAKVYSTHLGEKLR